MKKILIFSIVITIFIIFNKLIVSKIIVFSFSKWTEKKILVEKIDIKYSEEEIIIHSMQVKSSGNFLSKNIFEADRIVIKYNFKSLFTNLIKINNLIFKNPKLYIVFDDEIEQKKIKSDNLGIADKLIPGNTPKIYPTKLVDINFLILSTILDNPKAYIKTKNDKKIISINLSDMNFNGIGNEKSSQHYKDIFKIILMDLYFSIPDPKLQKLIKNRYKSKYKID